MQTSRKPKRPPGFYQQIGRLAAAANFVPARERHEDKWVAVPESGCWLWTGAINKNTGYGVIWVNNKRQRAHRASWEIHRGKIPDGLWVLHKCDVKSCVNPAHLFLGTPQDNVADMIAKGRQNRRPLPRDRQMRGEGHGCSKISERTAIEICCSKEKTSVLAERYGLAKVTIRKIRAGSLWAHLDRYRQAM